MSKDDLFFKDEVDVSEFLFCHESDIHFTTDHADLVEAVSGRWRTLGFERVQPAI